MKRALLLGAVIGSFLLSACATPAQQDKTQGTSPKFSLKAAHYFKDDHPWQKGLAFFAKKVTEDTKGQVEIKIFNNGVLGSEADTLQSVKEGTLDFVVADPSAGSTFAKELDFFALPFMFRSYDHWQKSLDGEPGQKYAKLIEDKTGLKILGYWGGSSRNVLSTKKPVRSIDDLKGFKLRLVSSPLKVGVWKAVGAIPTPIAYMETYSALQSGVVDGMENESVAVVSMKFYEPAPNITRTEHEFTVRPLFMSKKTFDKLPPDLQQIVLKDAQAATVYERQTELKASQAAEKLMQDKYSVKFYDIDKEPFKTVTKPVIADFAQRMGLSDLLEDINKVQ